MAPSPAAASAFTNNTNFHVPKSASTIKKIPSKSHSNYFSKPLVISLILLVILLFPSQPPDFITQSIITEFWEIFRLLFIGIAVSYGLFSRKTAQIVTENSVLSKIDDGSDEYLPGISHLSSVFEDGFEKICGSDEENHMVQNYANFGYLQSSDSQFLGKETCVAEESEKIRSFVSKDVDESICEGDEKRVSQVWRSRYLKGESLVVVSNGDCFVDESSYFKPLNLPVRSLRKSVVDNDGNDFDNRGEFSRKIEAKGIDDVNVVKLRGLVPMNLEKKFKEVTGPSMIPWRSRSARNEKGGEMSNFTHSARVRPQSVGEFEFEQLKYSSFHGSKFSSSPELASLKAEKEGRTKDFRQSGISFSRTKVAPLDAKASFNDAKTRSFSIGDSLEMNRLSNFEYSSKNYGDHGEEGSRGIEFSDSDIKSATLAKDLSKAKSMRTIKPSKSIRDKKRTFRQFKADSLVKSGTGKEPEDPSNNHQNREFDSIFPMPKPKPFLPDIHNEEKEDFDDSRSTSEFETSSDENYTGNDLEIGEEFQGSEVDRKAGEFIAKFRAQIRLQKTSSTKGLDGW